MQAKTSRECFSRRHGNYFFAEVDYGYVGQRTAANAAIVLWLGSSWGVFLEEQSGRFRLSKVEGCLPARDEGYGNSGGHNGMREVDVEIRE